MRLFAVLLLCMAAACTRPLTPAEAQFGADLFGDSLDTDQVRVSRSLGLTPPPALPNAATVTRVVGTDRACVRVPQPTGERQPAQAMAFNNRMMFSAFLYSGDMALAWPERVRFPTLLVLAHELTHVWQWQNRAETGYTPWRAAAESLRFADPYYSTRADAPIFFAFGYEQQAAIVEDYVCFTAANPDHPRRQELREILAPVLPLDQFDAAIRRKLS